MDEPYAEIDFVGGRFVLASKEFSGFKRRELVSLIRGCGGHVFRQNNAQNNERLTAVLFSLHHEIPEMNLSAPWWWEEQIVASSGLGLSAHERMSMLRGALQGTPSQAAWHHAIAVLEAWPNRAGIEDAVQYVADLTKEWPARMRTGTRRWVKRAVSGVPHRLPLAGSLTLRNGQVDPSDMPRVFAAADRLEHVTLQLCNAYPYPIAELEAALTLAGTHEVTSLRLDFFMSAQSEQAELVASRCGADTEVLELRASYQYRERAYVLWWPLYDELLAILERRCPRLELRLIGWQGETIRVRRNGKEMDP